MRWLVAIGWLLVGLLSGFAAIAGVASGGFSAVWPPESWNLSWETLWRPDLVDAGLLTLSVAGVVFAICSATRSPGPRIEPTASERWGRVCLGGLAVSTLLIGASLSFVVFGPSRGATVDMTGAVFAAATVQATVALLLVAGLFFLPKSKAGFTTLVIVWGLETGSLAAVYAYGAGLVT